MSVENTPVATDAKAEKLPASARPPRPDKEAHERKMNEMSTAFETLKKRVTEIREQIGNPGEAGTKLQERRTELRNEIQKAKDEMAAVRDKRGELLDQIKLLQEGIKKKGDDMKGSKDKLAFKSAADVDRKIQELEDQVSSGTLRLVEEKRLLTDISGLRKQRKMFESIGQQEQVGKQSIENDKKKIDLMRQKLDSFDPEQTRIKAALDKLFTELRAMDAKKDEDQGKLKPLFAERNKINKEMDGLKAKRNQAYNEFKKQQDAWYAFQREEKARRDEEYKKQREEQQRQRKIDAIQRAKENAELPAFETEIGMCNVLSQLLGQLIGVETEESAATTTNGNAKPKFEIRKVSDEAPLPKGVSGTVALKKKSDRQDEESYYGLGKGKKKAAPATQPHKDSDSLKFDLSVLDQFFKLKINVPTKYGDIQKTLDALKAKKAYFFENQERVTKENIEKAKALEEKLLKAADTEVDAVVAEAETTPVEASA